MSGVYTPNCEIKPGMFLPEGVTRIALTLEYNGMAFKGFQKQASARNTVQAALESALSMVANHPVTVVCAGRTDAGVHATQQVIHFDTTAQRPHKAWLQGVNTQLPEQVRVTGAYPVSPDFHARFSATARTYRYITALTPTKPAVLSGLVSWVKFSLNDQLMQMAAQSLIGEHDFTSFRAANCQAHQPVRTIKQAQFSRQGNLLVFEITANAFLYHMVRNIMGTLFDVGRGNQPTSWVADLLALQDRSRAAPTAPPQGLYFVAAEYEARFGVPTMPIGPEFIT